MVWCFGVTKHSKNFIFTFVRQAEHVQLMERFEINTHFSLGKLQENLICWEGQEMVSVEPDKTMFCFVQVDSCVCA
jgi:hypothetical protein